LAHSRHTETPPTFRQRLDAAWTKNDSLLCVGLDPDPARFPGAMRGRTDRIYDFCRDIVDATAAHACAFKPQIAYFASQRAEDQLEALIMYIRENHPGLPVILDSKRGDIGSTAEHYAREAFERYKAHAVTVNPYMGMDSVEPYLAWPDRGVIVLCRTSNAGGSDLQALDVEGGEKLYQRVARLVAGPWNTSGQCALVVGATFPAELADVRRIVGDDLPLLVPGIGAQGGDIDASVAAGRTRNGTGMIINSSRAILYASADGDHLEVAGRVARETKDAINRARRSRG
jgi:orotidine-5'-phosphate decarboxylase